MRSVSLVLAGFACAGHGRRLQNVEHAQNGSDPIIALARSLLATERAPSWQAAPGLGKRLVARHADDSRRAQSLVSKDIELDSEEIWPDLKPDPNIPEAVSNFTENPRIDPVADVQEGEKYGQYGASIKLDPTMKSLFGYLENIAGSKVVMYEAGGCITSFKPKSKIKGKKEEVFFIRPDAKLDGSKPISGGVPHCFPQFGPGDMQQHGFARNAMWMMTDYYGGNNTPWIVMEMNHTYETDNNTPAIQDMWPYKFKSLYKVTLYPDDSMSAELNITNVDDKPFEFTNALHTYFKIGDIDKTTIEGNFKGSTVFDRMLDPPARITEERDVLTIDKETDRVYEGVSGEIKINDKKGRRIITMKNEKGWADTVVWNPYGKNSMGYKNFVCVESGVVKEPVKLAPGETWTGIVSFSVETKEAQAPASEKGFR